MQENARPEDYFNLLRADGDSSSAGLFVKRIAKFGVLPVPDHNGVALALEDTQAQRHQWGLTIEQARMLADSLNKALSQLSSDAS